MKLTAPLFSVSASGSIRDTLTFSKRKTCNQVRFQRKQKDVITAPRTAQRLKFIDGVYFWNHREYGDFEYGWGFYGIDPDGFELLAAPLHMTGYNLFLSGVLTS